MSHGYPQYVDSALEEKAISLWKSGELVAIPTETVYGLGADARNSEAVAKIYAIKSRPRFNPLIIHVSSIAIARRYVQWNAHAERLSLLWPGPLTLVLEKKAGLSDLVTAGGDTVGVRIPAHPLALSLLAAFDGPIAAPSANRSGRISPTTAAHVRSELGDAVPLVVDGGPCEVGVESTVIDVTGELPVILRSGAITREMIGPVAECVPSEALRSPGLLESHYAPEKPVRLNATHAQPDEALLAFGPAAPTAAYSVNLSERGDPVEAATRLFAALHMLDAAPVRGIAAMPIPSEGIGEAINDRLRRAAAPRPSAH